jgi:transposase-like protein
MTLGGRWSIVEINTIALSLYSRGMTTRDIEAHFEEVYGAQVSRELISNITEVVVDEIKMWQSRSLHEMYPILYIDGLRLRVKDNGIVTTKVAYLAIGVDLDGRKHALDCWIQDTEGAKFPRLLGDIDLPPLRRKVLSVVIAAVAAPLTPLRTAGPVARQRRCSQRVRVGWG